MTVVDQEQLAILKQGVEVWNKWREDNPDVEIDLIRADLWGANLSNANLRGAILVNTDLTSSILTDCKIYGISAWDLSLEGAEQSNLVITRDDQPIMIRK